ncbi:MAG: transposase [Gammaproteobacteria bacterium]|nr:transposase [Gammaproteobacteria bacterium]
MPRMGRIVMPGVAHHIVQRGHNREVVFRSGEDFGFYLHNLRELKSVFSVKLYAFCLMTNHVHLLLEPNDSVGLALLLKHLAGRQTRYVNRRIRRTGTLWEGRYKSSPVETETYLLACSRYIELNPVRAGMVESPGHYRWSSFRLKIGLVQSDILNVDPAFEALGTDKTARQLRYRRFVELGVPQSEYTLIREALQRGQLTGGDNLSAQVESKLGLRVSRRGRGRPSNNGKNKSVPF